jgi:RHS repeat-associated protein
MDNRKKYNGIEFDNDLNINTYEAFFRNLDPQTGRWWQIDPKTENMEMWSPYVSNYNNPITYQDFLGDEPDGGGEGDPPTGFLSGLKNSFVGVFSSIGNTIAHPIDAFNGMKNESIGTRLERAANMGTMGNYGFVKDLVVNTSNSGVPYALGHAVGSTAANATVAVVTDGAVRGVKGVAAIGKSENSTTLFRGVNESRPEFNNALNGKAIPKGGNATPAEHNAGNTNSPFTSWTTNRAVAENYALRPNGNGVVLETTVPKSSTIKSPNTKIVNLKQSPGTRVSESEVLLKKVTNAKVTPIFNY